MKTNNSETAILAGGCFWCTESIFKRLAGVLTVTPGYAGGQMDNPTYAQVCSGNTGHAEAIQIKFDPEQIGFADILDVFWHTHDPTTLNRQGNDIGTQYRSAVFYLDESQKTTALKLKGLLEKEKVFLAKIVTEIVPFSGFFPAEDYHKNYFDRNNQEPYCNLVISPKIHKLLSKYGDKVKEEYKS